MNVTVCICTHGTREWSDLAERVALPSAREQGAHQIVSHHYWDTGTLAEARNFAAEQATGDWLCFLDADDRLAPGYLAAMQAAMRHWNLARRTDLTDNPLLLLPAVQYVHDDGRSAAAPVVPAWGRSVVDVNAGVIGTLVPRQLFREVGGFREFAMYEDWDLWLRCLIAGARPIAVPEAVYLADAAPGRNAQADAALGTYWTIRREHEPHLSGVRWR